MPYYHSFPEHGIHGQRTAVSRLSGLEVLKNRKFDSVLDLGCAEGLITAHLAQQGARVVHGFEGKQERVDFANQHHAELLNQQCDDWGFYQGDFADLDTFYRQFSNILWPKYDVVLALGIFHKARGEQARQTVHHLTSRCEKYLLYRGNMAKDPDFLAYFAECGFYLQCKTQRKWISLLQKGDRRPTGPLFYFVRAPYYERSKIGKALAPYGL